MMPVETARSNQRQWGVAWVVMSLTVALHVTDEALTDFLSIWNPMVESLRASLGWVPFPTFSFEVWLGGLIVGVALGLWLSRYAFAGARWMVPLSYFVGVVMIFNGLGHIAGSLYLGRLAPGVYSSPLLLAAAAFLLVATRRWSTAKKPSAATAG